MSVHRFAAKRDTIEPKIISALLAAGCTVQQLSVRGCPDLLVGFVDPETGEPKNALIECKSKGGKLTDDQKDWIAKWAGQVFVVYSVEDAMEAIGR